MVKLKREVNKKKLYTSSGQIPLRGVSPKSDQNFLNSIIVSSGIFISDFSSFVLLK